MKTVYVSDYTLKQAAEERQLPLSFREKTAIARSLDSLGVDAIELASVKNIKEDAIIFRTISSAVKNSMVCIPVGTTAESIADAWECVKDAKNPCLQVVLPASTVGMEYALHLKAPKMLEVAAKLCGLAGEKCAKVELVCADASRADPEFLAQLCRTAAENGACAVTLCDDAGIQLPQDCADMVSAVKAACPVPVYVQPSDAIGMGAASAVAAIAAGADGVKTAFAGKNTLSAERMADVIRVKGDDLGISCRLALTEIHRGFAGLTKTMQNVPAVSESAAAADQDALTLTSASSLTDVCEAACALGYELSDEDNGRVYEEFQRVAERKDSLGAKELEAIIATAAMQVPATYHVDSYVVNSGNIISSMSQVTLRRGEEKLPGISAGDGPIDSSFRAIEQIIGHHYELDDFQIQSVTEGREAVGNALVRLRADNGKLYSGNGISTDIIGASIRAFVNALNKIVYEEN